jgi:hypothetical protein
VVSKQDEIDLLELDNKKISEAQIFNIVRPAVNDVINYLIKGKKWYNNDIRQFKQYIVNTIAGKGTGKIADAFNKLPDLIYSHGNAGTLFDEQGDSGTKLPDLPDVSGAVFTSQIKSLVDALNGTIDNWNQFGDERPSSQQNTAVFYPVVLNDVNNLINKYIDRDRYEADGRFNRSFRNDMDNQLNSILQAEPFNKNLSKDLKQKILDHAKDKTPFTVGGNRRKKAMNIEKIRASEFLAESFKGLKKPKEGLVRPDPRAKPFILKNPKSRVNVKSEGSGLLTKSNVNAKRQELLRKLGMGMVCEDESSSDSENEGGEGKEGGAGTKADYINFYTNHDVKKVIKFLTDKGKQYLKKTFNRLLEDYKEQVDEREDFIFNYLLARALEQHGDNSFEATDLENEMMEEANKLTSDDPESDVSIMEEEIMEFIDKNLKNNKPRFYDAERNLFLDKPKPESGRRARGKGKKGGAGSKGNWINFYTDEDVKEVLKHINPTGKKRLKSAYNELLEKFLEESVNEYSSLSEIGFIGDECITALLLYPLLKYYLVGEKTQEIKSLINKYKLMIEEECDDESEQTDEFKKIIKKHLSKPNEVIIALGKKKIGHKKKKPSFTEI